MADPNNVPMIVLTGGPCAGKTSVLSYLAQELPEHGVRVLTVPEAARMLLGSGVTPALVGARSFQGSLIGLQLAHEAAYRTLAEALPPGRTVILCDRGAMDSRAYVDEPTWTELLFENRWRPVDLRDRAYQAVIHLVTAADGAEPFYVSDAERQESPEDARALDRRTQRAWTGHPHLHIIDNSTDFAGKRHRVLSAVLHDLGLPVPLEIERKYRLTDPWPAGLGEIAEPIDIEQAYVQTEDGEVRVRRRGQGGDALYFQAVKRMLRPGVREEREWQITADEYYAALRLVPPTDVIQKRRHCFVYGHQYFELDCFISPRLPYSLLEVELTDEVTQIELPPWVEGAEDVTEDLAYSNREIIRRAAA